MYILSASAEHVGINSTLPDEVHEKKVKGNMYVNTHDHLEIKLSGDNHFDKERHNMNGDRPS